MKNISWFAFGSGVLLSTPAWANTGGDDETLQSILLLIGVVSVAFLAAHLLVERISRRFGVITGIEHIVFGALLGPVLNSMDLGYVILDAERINLLTPAIVLGTGSLGLLTGLHVDLRRATDGIGRESIRVALIVSLMTLTCVSVLPASVLYYFAGYDAVFQWAPGLLVLGSVALVSDSSPLRSLVDYLGVSGPGTEMAIRIARVCASFAVILFGTIFCVYNPDGSGFRPGLSGLEWFGIHLLMGIVLGIIFGTFLRRDFEDDKILTVVIGMVIFTSGVAYYLKLSPVFVNFILGVVLIHTCRHANHVQRMLEKVERPLYIVLFFFAGAKMMFAIPWQAYAAVGVYLLLRHLGRWLGGNLAVRTAQRDSNLPGLGRVLLAPGGLSVALVLDFDHVYGERVYAPALYTGLIIAIVISEIISYRRSRSWLIDATDVTPDQFRRAFRASETAEVA